MISKFVRFTTLAFAVVALMSTQAKAEGPIALIDLAKIIETSVAGKDLQSKFKSKKEAIQKEAAAYEKDLQSKEKTLMEERKTLDEKAFNEKKAGFEKSLRAKREELVNKNVALEKSKNEALKAIQTKVQEICAGIAKEKNIQVILDFAAVVIAQQTLDITPDVIKKLDTDLKSVSLK